MENQHQATELLSIQLSPVLAEIVNRPLPEPQNGGLSYADLSQLTGVSTRIIRNLAFESFFGAPTERYARDARVDLANALGALGLVELDVLLSPPEVSTVFHVSNRAVANWTKQDLIPSVNVGKNILRIARRAVLSYFDSVGGLDDVYTGSEVAKKFDVDPRTVHYWVEGGKLKAIRTPSGQIRVLKRSVDAYFTDQN